MKKSVIEIMQAMVLFKDIPSEDLKALAPLFTEKNLTEGTTVFVENMPGESLYLIREGTVQISKLIAEGQEKTLVILGPEDFFGEMAILEGGTRTATARVVETAHLLRLQKGDFESLCERNPRVGLKLLRNITRLFISRVRSSKEEYKNMLQWCLEARP